MSTPALAFDGQPAYELILAYRSQSAHAVGEYHR